jgi:hypothetical protein
MGSKREPRWYLYATAGVEQPQPWPRILLPRAALVSADGYWAEHKGEVYLNLGAAKNPVRSAWNMAA